MVAYSEVRHYNNYVVKNKGRKKEHNVKKETKVQQIKNVIKDLGDILAPRLLVINSVEVEAPAATRGEVLAQAKEVYDMTEMQVDNYLSYLREDRLAKNNTPNPDHWWFSYDSAFKCYYHVPRVIVLTENGVIEADPVNRRIKVEEAPLVDWEAMTKVELLDYLKSHIEQVVAVDGQFNTKSTKPELITLARKVAKKVK